MTVPPPRTSELVETTNRDLKCERPAHTTGAQLLSRHPVPNKKLFRINRPTVVRALPQNLAIQEDRIVRDDYSPSSRRSIERTLRTCVSTVCPCTS